MAALRYLPRLPGVKAEYLGNRQILEDWIKNRNMLVFTFFQPSSQYRQLDIVLVHPLDFNATFKRKKIISSGGIKIKTVSSDDLIEMKKYSGRKQDLSDIEHLKRAAKINGKKKRT